MTRINELEDTAGKDDVESKSRLIEALFELSDAMIADGMELWDEDRIDREVSAQRGEN